MLLYLFNIDSVKSTTSRQTQTGHDAFYLYSFYLMVKFYHMDRKTAVHLELSYPAEGAGGGARCTPVTELPVLARTHEVLASPVTGMLIQGPVTFHHFAGVDVPVAEALLHRLAVVTELHHLALEIRTLVDAHTVLPSTVLVQEIQERDLTF